MAGRVLTRACYEHYGLDSQEMAIEDLRICQKCYLNFIRRRHSLCPIGTCKTVKRKVKLTRNLPPPPWYQLNEAQQTLVTVELRKFIYN